MLEVNYCLASSGPAGHSSGELAAPRPTYAYYYNIMYTIILISLKYQIIIGARAAGWQDILREISLHHARVGLPCSCAAPISEILDSRTRGLLQV